jgi:hypothetical protein
MAKFSPNLVTDLASVGADSKVGAELTVVVEGEPVDQAEREVKLREKEKD